MPAGGGATQSTLEPVEGAARRAEIARMLGGGRMSDTGLAHAAEMLAAGHDAHSDAGEEASAAAACDAMNMTTTTTTTIPQPGRRRA